MPYDEGGRHGEARSRHVADHQPDTQFAGQIDHPQGFGQSAAFVTIVGDVAARLFASTTGSDADWVVKLIDVYPSDASAPEALRGRQRLIAHNVLRGRFRKSLSMPEPITPGAVLDYDIDLHAASHVFRKGHRIAVQVQSSWFPLIDRNPQNFVPNIFKAQPQDFRAHTHKIYHDADRPSSISVGTAAE